MKGVVYLVVLLASQSAFAITREDILQLVKKPRREFINGVVERQSDLQQLPVIGACIDAFLAVGAAAQNVADECAAVADGLPDLLGDLDNLLNLCDNEALADCQAAAQNVVAEAQNAIATCTDSLNIGGGDDDDDDDDNGSQDDNVPPELSNAPMQQVACMSDAGAAQQAVVAAAQSDAPACIESMSAIAKENADVYAQCEDELYDETCSEQCEQLAKTIRNNAGCCLTGMVYSMHVGERVNVNRTSAGDLTACGVTLNSCDELNEVFADIPEVELPPTIAVTSAPGDTSTTSASPGEGPDGSSGGRTSVNVPLTTASAFTLRASHGTVLVAILGAVYLSASG